MTKVSIGIGALGRLLLTLLMILFFAVGCLDSGSDGVSGDGVVLPSLESHETQVLTSDTQAGYPVNMTVGISSVEDVTDVPVSFYLLNKGQADAAEGNDADVQASYHSIQTVQVETGQAEVEQYHWGSITFASLKAGNHPYHATMDVPEDVPAGEYYIIVHVDPANAIAEIDEGKNNSVYISGEIQIANDTIATKTPNIVLESVILDRDAVLLGSEEEVIDYLPGDPYPPEPTDPDVEDFGATAKLSISGIADVADVLLTMCIEVPGSGCEPVEIWNSETSQYEHQLVVATISPGEPTSVHLGAHIPDGVRALIENQVVGGADNTFNVKVSVDAQNNITEHEDPLVDDNTMVASLNIFTPAEIEP